MASYTKDYRQEIDGEYVTVSLQVDPHEIGLLATALHAYIHDDRDNEPAAHILIYMARLLQLLDHAEWAYVEAAHERDRQYETPEAFDED